MSDPARTLEDALAAMRWEELPGRYALVGLARPPRPADLARLAPPAQLVVEEGETSLLVADHEAAQLLAEEPDARAERDLVWFRFEAPMGWEVVGFLARVTGALAAAGVSLGAVCGFSRDHLFVPASGRDVARRTLAALFPEAPGTPFGKGAPGAGSPVDPAGGPR